ncbi:MAG: DUF5693 family protein [Thermanaeromonas sp.]|uniref:DUF5693 family protein n=1 Tax=Thermanaeromonas sp. TaxID=2003697 RepID=UPI002437B62E|nr:DUF5693 family protein [Thermanaeromonas sp.]MCG0277422.1 DUF5693 family protein [Thermanaeromonas sp.]
MLFLFLALGVAASLKIAVERVKMERANRSVVLAVNYQDIAKLSWWTGLEEEEVLERFKAQGVNGVLFKEQTLGELVPRYLRVYGHDEVTRLFPEAAPRFRSGFLYFVGDRAVLERVKFHLDNKLPVPSEVVRDASTGQILALGVPDSSLGEIEKLGLGFPMDKLDMAIEKGLYILPQLKEWPVKRANSLAAILNSIEKYSPYTAALLFNDRVIPGYPGALATLAEEVKKMGVPLGMIEFFSQQGLKQLALLVDKQVVRVHSLGEAANISWEEGVDRLTLAASDRNVRILILPLFFQGPPSSWLDANLKYVEAVSSSLAREGLEGGKASPFPGFPTSRLLWTLVVLGVLAGGVLFLSELGFSRLAWALGVLGFGGWLLALVCGYATLARKIMALGSAVIFPTLSVWLAFKDARRPLGLAPSFKLVLQSTLLSLAGGLLLAGLLSDTVFFLKLDQFMGVKVAFVLPLLLFTAAAVYHEEKENFGAVWRKWFGQNLTVFIFLLIILGSLVAFLYVNRSGNESVGLLPLEGQVRMVLERLLLVRPRTKEFLLGYPVFLLALSFGYKHKYLPLWLLALAGQVSLVNTLAHLHTPLLISLLRIFNGLWLGLLLGIVLLASVKGAKAMMRRS